MGLFETIHIPNTIPFPRSTSGNTVMPRPQDNLAYCPKCGTAFEGKKFCAECGTSSIKRHTLVIQNTPIPARNLALSLSQWLAENPYVYDVELSCDMHHFPNDLDRTGQIIVDQAQLTYSVSPSPMDIQYGVEFLYTYNVTLNYQQLFSAKGENTVKMWQEQNPHLRYRAYTGGRITGDNGVYQQYALVLYSFPVAANQATVPENPKPEKKFCQHCGAKITGAGNFCNQCGKKL